MDSNTKSQVSPVYQYAKRTEHKTDEVHTVEPVGNTHKKSKQELTAEAVQELHKLSNKIHLSRAADDEAHQAIANVLALGDEFSQSLILFDMMIATDTGQTILIDDELRIQTLCRMYGIVMSDAVKEVLLYKLAQYRLSRKVNVLRQSGLPRERNDFIRVITLIFELSKQKYKQK